MMRSLGFYPSQREVEEITQEARLVAAVAGRGTVDSLTFDEFLVMYVNHRPIFGVSKEQIADAFLMLSVDGSGVITRDSLLRFFSSYDESLTGDDLAQCLRMLVGADDPAAVFPDHVDAKEFAETILGFQDYIAAST